MSIIVTGAAGFIGTSLAQEFPGCICCDIKETHGFFPPDEIDEILFDTRNISGVYHLGAISSTTETDTYQISTNNISFSCMLLEACIKRDIPFVYASSASVYGSGSAGFVENIPLSPLNYYAISKASFDNFVMQKIIDNPTARVVGLRYFNVYGAGEGDKKDMASPIYKFIKQAETTGIIKIFKGSDKYLRDFVHVSDVVNITRSAINLPSGIYNVGTGTARSFLDVATIISSLTNAKVCTIPFPSRLSGKYQEYTCSDNVKINKYIDPKRLTLEAGIKMVMTAGDLS